jgi:hypothetical protein
MVTSNIDLSDPMDGVRSSLRDCPPSELRLAHIGPGFRMAVIACSREMVDVRVLIDPDDS